MSRAEGLGVDITGELASRGLSQAQVARVRSLYEECASKFHSHQQRANWFNRTSVFFGLPISIFAAVSGTAAFASLGQEVGGSWRLLVIILSLTITILSTIQTFFHFSEKAAKEQHAANQYSDLVWKIRRWANLAAEGNHAYEVIEGRAVLSEEQVEALVGSVLLEMQDIETQYRGGTQKSALRQSAEQFGVATAEAEPSMETSSVATTEAEPSMETAPPTLTSVKPLPNAEGVARNTRVTALFSKDMDPDTITKDTFFLVKKVDRSPVPSHPVEYNTLTKAATFRLRTDLEENTTYQATVATGIKDRKGYKMGREYTWEFTVGHL
jgi:hypothetical protein